MKIAICTIGSRGDIQPFLVLGEYLSENGFQVKVASAKMYEALAANYKVTYQSFEGNYASIVDDEALKKEIGRNPFMIGKELKEKVYPIIESSLETYFDLVKWADVVLYHPKTMLDGICGTMQEKLIKAYVVPAFTPTKEFTNPIVSFLPIPKFLNKLTYLFNNIALSTFNTPVKNFRAKHKLAKGRSILETPVIYGVSPLILDRPADYPKDVFFSGFWMKDNKNDQLSEEVASFVSNEKKVLLITFGSMPYKSEVDFNLYVKAIVDHFDLKVLVVRGWALKGKEIYKNDQVLAIDAAPFTALFPLVDFVVHHGGAGTTAIALKSGLPQMICPVLHPFGDQYFWGKQIERNGVGVSPIPLKKLTVNKFIDSIRQLVDERLSIEADKLKQKLAAENGLLRAKEIIEKHYAQQQRSRSL